MKQLKHQLTERYKKEISNSLGCGNNFRFLDLKPGSKVLDLGCGNGRDTLEAAKRVGDSGEVTGLDLTPQMLLAAKANTDKEGLRNVRFVSGSIEKLPFPDNFFDVVISNCVINHALDKNQAYREIYRVLKDKGTFVISDVASKYPLPPAIKNDPGLWAECFGGAITLDEYFQIIEDANFTDITVFNIREYIKNGYDFISITVGAKKLIGGDFNKKDY